MVWRVRPRRQTDSDDLVRLGHFDPLDGRLDAEHWRLKVCGGVLHHRQESDVCSASPQASMIALAHAVLAVSDE